MQKKQKIKTLRLILGDQLNLKHSWFDTVDDDICYILMEVHEECKYVTHHIQKIAAIFNAMRTFSQQLITQGHHVQYLQLDDTENKKSIADNLIHFAHKYNVDRVQYQEPDEYRLDQKLKSLNTYDFELDVFSSEHFITERREVEDFYSDRKSWVMEYFYRAQRKQHNILMDENQPEGGEWNYDEKNRNQLPKNHQPPQPKLFNHDVSAIVKMLQQESISTIGSIDEKHLNWPKNTIEAEEQLTYFIDYLLPNFGQFQDAMHTEWEFIYHSRLSFAINVKMISPMIVIKAVEKAFYSNTDISIAQAEGFIRQILGWREYVRGVYWAKMPKYQNKNFFSHQQKLPEFYWSGKTKMKCMEKSISQSLQHGYAHHIQRLMITGNFALLTGVHPDEVDQWYLGIYVDAFEWVELPNTRGMSQFADGGIMGTKPYISSGSYINKMSNYCQNCHYNAKEKTSEKACPFNSLYWNFLDQHQDQLENNNRMRMMYATWNKMKAEKKSALLERASYILDHLNEL